MPPDRDGHQFGVWAGGSQAVGFGMAKVKLLCFVDQAPGPEVRTLVLSRKRLLHDYARVPHVAASACMLSPVMPPVAMRSIALTIRAGSRWWIMWPAPFSTSSRLPGIAPCSLWAPFDVDDAISIARHDDRGAGDRRITR